MKMAWFLLMVLFPSFSCHGIEAGLKISRQLQKSKITDEYDCVDIYKQLAFNNILLKNHKIEMSPSSLPNFPNNNELSDTSRSLGLDTVDRCPEGMVPIHRSRASKSISKLHHGNIHTLTRTAPGRHFAVFRNESNEPKINGASATIGIYNPPVTMDQVSMTQIWLECGPPDELNSVQIGWAVNPRLYGDNLTRMTAYWTADGYQKMGCYNTMCPGFVQVHPSIPLGVPLNPTVGGGQLYEIQPLIIRQNLTGNWWLILPNSPIGYWPKEIVPLLRYGATSVQYGGWTFNSPDGWSPPMGNGLFPKTNYQETSVVSDLKIKNENYILADMGQGNLQKFVDNINCYDAVFLDKAYGNGVSYGGPGGLCGI